MKRLLLAVFIVLGFVSVSQAQYVKVLGVAEQSGKVITSGVTSTTSVSKTFPGAAITIYSPTGSGTIASIFSTSAGTVKANPFSASLTDATIDFYIAPGSTFDVRISGTSGGVTITPFTRSGYTAPGTTGISLVLCGGTADTSLLTALNALGGTIQIPKGITCASNTQTISAALQVDNGGLLKPINSSQTLTLTGPQIGGNWQRFTNALSGQGTISFSGNTKLSQIVPQWWGATGDSTTDDLLPLRAWIVAITDTVKGYLPAGVYKHTDSLTLTGNTPLFIDGAGADAKLLNLASAGKPTFVLNGKTYWTFQNFAVIGRAANPNMAFDITNGSAFGALNNLYLTPNGVGIHLDGVNTIEMNRVYYWPSGFGNGATTSAGARTNAVLADGLGANDIHIRNMDAVGVETIADGGAMIRWNVTTLSNAGVSIVDSELEGADRRAIDLKGVSSVFIANNFLDRANVRFLLCRHVAIFAERGDGAPAIGTSWTIGDGTAPNMCRLIVGYNLTGDTFTVDAQSDRCGVIASNFNTYTNSGTNPITITSGVGGGLSPDQIGSAGIKERNRTVTMGGWTTPTFSAGNFTSPSGTWVVGSGDVVTYEYSLVGLTMTVNFRLDTTTITGTPTGLRIAIPGGFTAAKRSSFLFVGSNNGGAYFVSEGEVIDGTTFINLYVVPQAVSNWAAGADNNYVRGSVTFEVQ